MPHAVSENSSGSATPVGEGESNPAATLGDDWRNKDDGSDHSVSVDLSNEVEERVILCKRC